MMLCCVVSRVDTDREAVCITVEDHAEGNHCQAVCILYPSVCDVGLA